MILRRPIATIDEIDEIGRYHVESAYVSSDDLTKRILRVKTDHGNEFGIRLEDDAPPLERGMVFEVGEGKLLAIETLPDKMLKIKPRSMDEMGRVAHYLGNLHKPVEVADGVITLLYDPVVDKDLVNNGVVVEVIEMELDHPLRHIDLAKLAQGDHHHHHHPHHHPEHRSERLDHHHEGPVRHLHEDAEVLEERHHEHAALRANERSERRVLREDERLRHAERKELEDVSAVGEPHYYHPVHHLEEDAEELLEHHEEHKEFREAERDEWRELEEEERERPRPAPKHEAHPRMRGPRE